MGRPVGRWRPASSSAGDGLIVLSTDSLTLRSETPANVARHPQGAVNGHRRGLATGPEGLSPRLEDGKEPVRVSSVVVAVTFGMARTRFGDVTVKSVGCGVDPCVCVLCQGPHWGCRPRIRPRSGGPGYAQWAYAVCVAVELKVAVDVRACSFSESMIFLIRQERRRTCRCQP